MPKQMTFTDSTGNENAESFWILTYYEVLPEYKSMIATITGYRSQSDYEDGSQQIGAKSYRITESTTFDAYFAESVLSAEGVTLALQIYQYASDTEDTDGESFFSSAVDV